MSYCRLGEDSDIYVIQSGDTWCCCGCMRGDELAGTEFDTLAELKLHLEEHVRLGDKVPEYAMARVRREMDSGLSDRTMFDMEIPPQRISPPEWN